MGQHFMVFYTNISNKQTGFSYPDLKPGNKFGTGYPDSVPATNHYLSSLSQQLSWRR